MYEAMSVPEGKRSQGLIVCTSLLLLLSKILKLSVCGTPGKARKTLKRVLG